MCHPSINKTFLSFLCLRSVTSYIEGITYFERLCGKNDQESL
jgi:hypothetical protein